MSEPIIVPGVQALPEYVGKRLGPSEWVEITQEKVNAFAAATGDHQWIHTDPERAKTESPYGSTIAHGYLTLSLSPTMIDQLYRIEPCSMTVNAGIERMSLKEPVRVGSRVRLWAELKKLRGLPSGGQRATVGLTFELEGVKRPACLCDSVVVYMP